MYDDGGWDYIGNEFYLYICCTHNLDSGDIILYLNKHCSENGKTNKFDFYFIYFFSYIFTYSLSPFVKWMIKMILIFDCGLTLHTYIYQQNRWIKKLRKSEISYNTNSDSYLITELEINKLWPIYKHPVRQTSQQSYCNFNIF